MENKLQMTKKIIVFTIDPPPAYGRKDIEFMSAEFDVHVYYFQMSGNLIFELLKQFIFLIRNSRTPKLFYCMFVSYHTFLPSIFAKLFRKKLVLVPGGTDCVSFPSIGYGNFSKTLLSFVTKFAYKNASHIIPVTDKLVKYKYDYTLSDYPYQGYAYFCKNIKTPYTAINIGYNSDKWTRTLEKQKNLFLTIAYKVDSERGFLLKGLDSVVRAAELFPDQEFHIVGIADLNLVKDKPKNLIISNNIPFADLIALFNRAAYYIQLSLSEGFPSTFCESMLCECVPIGSNVGAIPDIIGDCGFIVSRKEDAALEDTIKKALAADISDLGKKARKRIMDIYPENVREEQVMNLIKSLL